MAEKLFSFSFPINLVWGSNALAEISKETRKLGRRAFVIVSGSAAQNGLLDIIHSKLSADGIKSASMVASGEPTLTALEKGLQEARKFSGEVIVAAGGGSAMDLGKAVAGLFHEPGVVREYFNGRTVENRGIPLITVPTVFGSGAEATPNAVLSDPYNLVKQSIRHPDFTARATVIDPILGLGLPAKVTAYSGLDGLCQAIEAFTSKRANAITDALAVDAAVRFARDLSKAVEDNRDLAARESLAVASVMGGIALAVARLGAVHGLAHAIGINYRQPHGKVCAVLLPIIMRYNLSVAKKKYAYLGRLLGLNNGAKTDEALAHSLLAFVETLLRKLEIPLVLRELGIAQSDLARIVEEGMPSGSMKANPRRVVPRELVEHLKDNW